MKPTRVEFITPGVWHDDEDDADPPVTMPLARRPATFVAPEPVRPAAPQLPAWVTTPTTIDVAPVWTPTEGVRESTSAMDRAQALRVRLLPFVLLWLLLGVIVGAAVLFVAQSTPGAALVGLLVFCGLTAYSYYRLNRTDYEYSREGSEQLRIVTAADLARQQMEHEHELRRMALGAYLATLDRHDGGKR